MTQDTGRAMGIIGIVAVALLAGGSGYWFGVRGAAVPDDSEKAIATTQGESGKKAPKLLYYRNPMGLPDTSPTPKKDPMGMDYIAVYEDEGSTESSEPASGNQLRISTDKVQKMGVRTEAAQLRDLGRIVRAARNWFRRSVNMPLPRRVSKR